MNRKLLVILFFVVGTTCTLNASEKEDKILRDIERSLAALSGKGNFFSEKVTTSTSPRTYGLSTEDKKYWSNKSDPNYQDGQLRYMEWLRADPNKQPEEKNLKRPSTAPVKTQRESTPHRLSRGYTASPTGQFPVRLRKSASNSPSSSVSGGSTPRSISRSSSGRSTPVHALPLTSIQELRSKIDTIDTLYIQMKHNGMLSEKDSSIETVKEDIKQSSSPIDAAETIIEQIKSRANTKTKALTDHNPEINELQKEFAEYDLVDYVTAFFKLATSKNQSAKDAMHATIDKPIVVKVEIPDEWRLMSGSRSSFLSSSRGSTRPTSPARFK